MNTRSIRFRLIVWYAGLLALVLLGFDAYAYHRLQAFLREIIQTSLQHRAQQIAQGIVREIPARGEAYAAAEIEARYAPALNDKFVRVTRSDGTLVYVSAAPNDRNFTPEKVPLENVEAAAAQTREQIVYGVAPMLIASSRENTAGQGYLVEVGASLAPSRRVLRALLLTLAAGLPILLGAATWGGYFLMKRALAPVQQLTTAAQEITLHHLARRLPVSGSGDEISSLSEALNQMIARIDESFQHTSRFTADASHELRTPLAIMHGELEAILLGQELGPALRDALGSLLEEVERLVQIVEGLFALAKLDAGAAQAQRVRFNLGDLVETTAEQMCLLAEEKHITLVCDAGEAVEVEGDRTRLQQVVVNVLDNAIKYTPCAGRVSMSVKGRDGVAILEVADSGPGVAAGALPHVFERFFRGDEVRSREVAGAGLGLSIVQSICTAHRGSARAENLIPSGFRLTVELPRAS